MKLKQHTTFIFIILAVTVFLVLCAAAQGSFTSSGRVSFNTKGVTPPVNPEIPVEPQEPPEVSGTGQEGNLTLDVVPHPYFGEYPVPTLNTIYKSKIVAGTGNAAAGAQTFLQVSDARPRNENIGWNVTVKADRFINSADSGNYISGAKIYFSAGEVNGPSTDNMPVSKPAALNCIDTGDQNEVSVFVAQSGNGVGTWVSRMYPTPWASPAVSADNDMIQLFIPANSGAVEGGTYISNLIWTLADTP